MKLRSINVSYRQVAVFRAALHNPFNDWTLAHFAQGFSWRPGSVSFATLQECGPIDIEVVRSTYSMADRAAARSIAVPFEVDASGSVEVASIGDGVALRIPAGSYRLVFEHGVVQDGKMWCRLWFEPTHDANCEAVVLKADEALHPSLPLLMEADPA